MVEIKPFIGIKYNIEKIGDISYVISPPWDLIDEKIEKKLLSLSKYNIAKLIVKENSPDEVKETFENWLKEKILIEDNSPCLYYLITQFEYNGNKYERVGLFSILKLEDFENRNIIPHEKIFPKYSENRYKLLQKCRANFCPVFMLYKDEEFFVENLITPNVSLKGQLNDEKILFGEIKEKEKIEEIQKFFKGKIVYIADGHHRYNASLMFYKNNPNPENSYVLVYLTNINSEGVLILPTHRYIPCEVKLNFKKEFIEIGEVRNLKELETEMKNNERKVGMYFNGKFYILKIKNYGEISKYESLFFELDSFLVDNFIIKNFVKFEENVEFLYHSSKEYLLNEYTKIGKGVIFFLNPVKKDIFLKVCEDGKIMPPKSTFFYPKVPSGLVIYKF